MSDLISRQDAIKELESGKDKKAKGEIGGFYNQNKERIIEHFVRLPSAQTEHATCYLDSPCEYQNINIALPTAERKKGKWEEESTFDVDENGDQIIQEWQSARCSVCGKYHTTPYMYYFNVYNYCPNCGARMEGKDE